MTRMYGQVQAPKVARPARKGEAPRVEQFDWVKAMDAVGGGHNLVTVGKIRDLMAAMGVTGLPLSPPERHEIERLRESAERNMRAAREIEARAVSS